MSENKKKLKISIDMDGTLWQNMAFFRELMKVMQGQGHEVGILTGHGLQSEKPDIDLMIARGFPKPDFWFGRAEEDLPYNGAVMKSRRILSELIDYHYDDLDYGNPDTLRLFKEGLGNQMNRLIVVHWREPKGEHFE